jgi:UDP-2-acetamido-3-amino-2,3-dideoxy-glucuronate N-acetyltransferase
MSSFIHPTAIIDENIQIGENTKIWAYSHVSKGARIGKNCIIGEGVHIGDDVIIGDDCKIQNHSLIYKGVTLEDEVFLGPNTVTTNDLYPRAKGDWSDRFRKTLFQKGSSVGANCTVLCGVTMGTYSMAAAGSVIANDIMDYSLVRGNPARHIRFFQGPPFSEQFKQKYFAPKL